MWQDAIVSVAFGEPGDGCGQWCGVGDVEAADQLATRAAAAAWYRAHVDSVHGHLARRVGEQLATDLVAETFGIALDVPGTDPLLAVDARVDATVEVAALFDAEYVGAPAATFWRVDGLTWTPATVPAEPAFISLGDNTGSPQPALVGASVGRWPPSVSTGAAARR